MNLFDMMRASDLLNTTPLPWPMLNEEKLDWAHILIGQIEREIFWGAREITDLITDASIYKVERDISYDSTFHWIRHSWN